MLFRLVTQRKRKPSGHSALLRFLLGKMSVTEGLLLKVPFLTAVRFKYAYGITLSSETVKKKKKRILLNLSSYCTPGILFFLEMVGFFPFFLYWQTFKGKQSDTWKNLNWQTFYKSATQLVKTENMNWNSPWEENLDPTLWEKEQAKQFQN